MRFLLKLFTRLFLAAFMFVMGAAIFESVIGGFIFLIIAFVVPFNGPGYMQARGYK